jgi:hypothetical protein
MHRAFLLVFQEPLILLGYRFRVVPSLQPEMLTNVAIASVSDLMESYGVTD